MRLVIAALVIASVSLLGCEDQNPMTGPEIEAATEGAGPIFVVEDGRETLEDTPEFYLGQPEADALAALDERCKSVLTYEGGWKRGNTVFKGCKLPGEPEIDSIRVGFNPEADMKVFTLEVRKQGWNAAQVRGRFTEHFGGEIERDVARAATIRMETPRHRLFGSWEEGESGVGHVIFGLSPEAVEKL